MAQTRVIPCLLVTKRRLVKTVRFGHPTYIGDPVNAVKIFNDKEVDEIIILDIAAPRANGEPDYDFVRQMAEECFMPLCYGGGIRSVEQARRLIQLGVEKIALNTQAIENPALVRELAETFGSQSIVVSIDVKQGLFGKYRVMTRAGRKASRLPPVAVAEQMAQMGAGELVVNSIDRDGTMLGYDLPLIRSIASAVDIPVIALGGAGSVEHLAAAVRTGGASAVAAGSLFVFQGKHRAVLITYPSQDVLQQVWGPSSEGAIHV
jgi:cyclase